MRIQPAAQLGSARGQCGRRPLASAGARPAAWCGRAAAPTRRRASRRQGGGTGVPCRAAPARSPAGSGHPSKQQQRRPPKGPSPSGTSSGSARAAAPAAPRAPPPPQGGAPDAAAAAAAAAPQLPPADFSRVRKAEFIGSAVDLRGCPPDGRYPEFAVIGRSNVGKSSLINMLTSNDKLARVSKEPGMTKTINHFLINNSWYLVDLPGYGFAKASKGTQGAWLGFTKDYFLSRDALVAVLLLVDASIPPQPLDLECADWLAASEVPFAVVFTKVDAKKKSGPTPSQNMAAFKKGLLEEWEALPACFATSSREGKGRAEVLGYLASLRQLDALEG